MESVIFLASLVVKKGIVEQRINSLVLFLVWFPVSLY